MDIWFTKLWKFHSHGFVEQRFSRFLGKNLKVLEDLKQFLSMPSKWSNTAILWKWLLHQPCSCGLSSSWPVGKMRDPGDEPVFTQKACEIYFTCHARQNRLAKFGKSLSKHCLLQLGVKTKKNQNRFILQVFVNRQFKVHILTLVCFFKDD